MAQPADDPVAAAHCSALAGLSADSSKVDICRAVLDLHTFHVHRRQFRSIGWHKLYRSVVHFSVDRQYGHGHLATAYLHYRLRTLYRLCGEGAPHPDEKPDQSRERKCTASRRRRQQMRQKECDQAVASSSLSRSASPLLSGSATSVSHCPAPVVSPVVPVLSRFHSAHPDSQLLASLFRLYSQKCGPLHGADFTMSSLPEKRSRRPAVPFGVPSVPQPDPSVPLAVSPGYAECTRQAFDALCEWLCEAAPPELRLSADSVFLDVGCGYGKCVVQARLRTAVRRSIGIEYVAVRYVMAYQMLTECIPAQFGSLRARLAGVDLLHGDATEERFAEQFSEATHVFSFDWVFNAAGKAGVLQRVQQSSSVRVFVTCQRLGKLSGFRKLHQMKLSTGVQTPTVYIYARESTMHCGMPGEPDSTTLVEGSARARRVRR